MEKQKVTQYFTFGCGHPHANGYVVVRGSSVKACREAMFEAYGDKWFTNYNSPEEAGVSRFGLHLVDEINAE